MASFLWKLTWPTWHVSAKSVSHLGFSGFKRSVIEKDTWQLSSDWTNLCVLKDQLFGDAEERSKNQVFFYLFEGRGVLFERYCKKILPSIVWPLVDLEETGDWCLAIQTGIMDSWNGIEWGFWMAIWRHGSIRLSIDGTSANQLSHTRVTRVLKFGSLSKYKVEMKHTAYWYTVGPAKTLDQSR